MEKYNLNKWLIVGCGMAMMATSVGIVWNCMSLFYISISSDLNCSRSSISLVLTIISFVYMLISSMYGRICQKYDYMKLLRLSSIILPIAYLSLSLYHHIYLFYFSAILLGICYSFVSILPLSLIISNWFHEKKGFALGITFAGSGFGGMIFSFVIGIILDMLGWRMTVRILSLIMAVIIIPAAFIIKKSPNIQQDTFIPHQESQDNQASLTKIKISKYYKCIALCAIPISILVNNIALLAPYMSDIGYTTTQAANASAIFLGMLITGQILLGKLYDKIGIKKTATLSLSLLTLTYLCLCYSQSFVFLVCCILIAGLGAAFNSVSYPIITQGIFGNANYNSINGSFIALSAFGGAVAPLISGILYDVFGNYNVAFAIFTIVGIIIVLIYLKFIPKNHITIK